MKWIRHNKQDWDLNTNIDNMINEKSIGLKLDYTDY